MYALHVQVAVRKFSPDMLEQPFTSLQHQCNRTPYACRAEQPLSCPQGGCKAHFKCAQQPLTCLL